jgi:phage-related protein
LSGFTTNLTTLASDLASFNNTTPEQAIEAIGAALRGETEPMRAYGVLLDDASLRQEALAQGLIKTTKQALTPQQKVLAAQALIMKQTTTAQGDFARTSGGLANQQRILSARFADFKTSIGAFALPLATKLFGFLNEKGIPALREISGGIRAFGAAWKANDGDVTSSGFPGFMEKLANTGRQVGAVLTGTIIPALSSFGGFLRDNRTLITTFAVGIGAMVVAFKAYQGILGVITIATKAWAAVQAVLNVVLAANPIGIIALALIGLAAGLVYAYKHSEKFRSIVNGAFGAVKGVVLGAVNAMTTAFHAVTGAIGGVINFVQNHWKTILPLILGPVLGIPLAIALHWDKIKGVFMDGVAAVLGALRSAWGAIVGVMSGPVTAVVNVLQAIWSRVYPIIALPFFIAKKMIDDFWTAVRTVFTSAATWVKNTFSKAWAAVSGVLSGPINTAKTGIATAISAVLAGFTAARTWVTGVFAKAWGAVAGVFTSAVNTAKNNITDRVDLIKGIFTAVKDWAVGTFAKAWSGLTAKLTGPVTAARNAITTILGSGKGGAQWVFSQAVSGIGRAWDGLQELAKKPIRFIIDTVLNNGLIGSFNWIAGKFGAPTIPTIPMPKGFASGGKFTGRIPGPPSPVDNLVARGPGGRGIGLATGEFIVNARDTARNLPVLKAINSGQGFANGGLFGKLKDGISGAFSAGKSFGQDVMGFLSDPVKWFKERLAGPLDRMSELGDSPFAQIAKAVPRKLVDTVSGKAKDLLGGLTGAGGGPINPGLGGALNWARSQVGKPYLWGGVGPMGYDCSGFMSAIVNVIRGSNPFRRLFATGSLPAGMFAPGPGAFEIGWFTGNPGHVAGTLNGTNVESRGGRGVVVGPGARGAHDSLFNRHGHLVGYANGGIVGDPPFDLLDPRGKAYKGQAVVPRSALSFDSGGMLPTGYSMVHNGTGKPEPVGHDFLRKDDLNGMRIVLDAGGVGELTGYIQVTAKSEINESNRALKRKVGR